MAATFVAVTLKLHSTALCALLAGSVCLRYAGFTGGIGSGLQHASYAAYRGGSSQNVAAALSVVFGEGAVQAVALGYVGKQLGAALRTYALASFESSLAAITNFSTFTVPVVGDPVFSPNPCRNAVCTTSGLRGRSVAGG